MSSSLRLMACQRRTVASLILAVAVILPLVAGSKYETPDQCSWTVVDANSYSSTTRASVICRVRTLEGEGTNLTAIQVDGTAKLRVECNDVLLFESTVSPQAFQRLNQLEELTIEDCKILNLPTEAFEGLRDLKRLTINTHNFEWGSTKSLELSSDSLKGLRELQTLDLGNNNMRSLPGEVFCVLGNLQTLNLTRNKFADADALGYASRRSSALDASTTPPRIECTGGLDVRSLDVS